MQPGRSCKVTMWLRSHWPAGPLTAIKTLVHAFKKASALYDWTAEYGRLQLKRLVVCPDWEKEWKPKRDNKIINYHVLSFHITTSFMCCWQGQRNEIAFT